MWLNQLITNFLEVYKVNNTASTLFCLQPSHITMTLDPKDTITKSLTTPQNSISDLLFLILCFSITGISGIIFFLYALSVCLFLHSFYYCI